MLALSFALLAAGAVAPAGTDDYAGWAYTSMDGDFPLRFRVVHDGGEERITYGSPAANAYDLTVTTVETKGAHVVFERKNSRGQRWRFDGDRAGDRWSGTIQLDDDRAGTFEAVRSPRALPTIVPRSYASCAGRYASADGHVLLVTTWQWGELKTIDLDDGGERTLFCTDTDHFFSGPAMYVPAPIESELAFERASDVVVEVAVTRAGKTRRYVRTEVATEEVTFDRGEVHLAGTLTLADRPGRRPAIVVLGGSNWTTRDTLNREVAVLASLGFVVLAYDQAGYGKSRGDRNCSFEETARDAIAGIEMLSARSDIDPSRIGVTGTSRGGWTAPLAASLSSDVAFVIIKVPPALSPAQQERTRRMNVFRSEKRSAQEVALAEQYLDAQFLRTRSKVDWDAFANLRERVATHDGWLDVLLGTEALGAPDLIWDARNMQFDPIPALQSIKCPILALFGERDGNVVPAENAPKMKAAFDAGGVRDATIVIIKRGNHGLSPVPDDGSPVPVHRYTGTCPEVWPTIRSWLETRGLLDESRGSSGSSDSPRK